MINKIDKRTMMSELTNTMKKRKVVVFDFDGTLTLNDENPLESLLVLCGMPKIMVRKFRNSYHSRLKVTDRQKLLWGILSKFFHLSNIDMGILNAIGGSQTMIGGITEAITELKSRGYEIHLLSGGLKPIVMKALGKDAELFDKIVANEVEFSRDGILKNVKYHGFDNAGKARYIQSLEMEGVDMEDIAFVGNGLNDIFVDTHTNCSMIWLNPEEKLKMVFDKEYVVKIYKDNVKNLNDIVDYIDNMVTAASLRKSTDCVF